MTLSDQACQAVLDLIGDGTLDVLNSDGKVLAVAHVAFKRAKDGVADMKECRPVEVDQRGTAATFEIKSDKGKVIISGKVGEDLSIDEPKLIDGGLLTVESFKIRFNK